MFDVMTVEMDKLESTSVRIFSGAVGNVLNFNFISSRNKKVINLLSFDKRRYLCSEQSTSKWGIFILCCSVKHVKSEKQVSGFPKE